MSTRVADPVFSNFQISIGTTINGKVSDGQNVAGVIAFQVRFMAYFSTFPLICISLKVSLGDIVLVKVTHSMHVFSSSLDHVKKAKNFNSMSQGKGNYLKVRTWNLLLKC